VHDWLKICLEVARSSVGSKFAPYQSKFECLSADSGPSSLVLEPSVAGCLLPLSRHELVTSDENFPIEGWKSRAGLSPTFLLLVSEVSVGLSQSPGAGSRVISCSTSPLTPPSHYRRLSEFPPAASGPESLMAAVTPSKFTRAGRGHGVRLPPPRRRRARARSRSRYWVSSA
jgi:hypothetical protein